MTTFGDERAFGVFTDAPFDGLESGIVLSTGQVADLPGENTDDGDFFVSSGGGDLSTDFGTLPSADGDSSSADGDSISLEIAFDVDDTAEKLFFDYVFGSEEFVEFGGGDFNDAFALSLNGTNLAFLSNGDLVNVNNLVPNPSDLSNPDYINNPVGPGTETRLDGYTVTLGFEGSLIQNARNFLSINIEDVGDGDFDSAVFIKGGSISSIPSTPEPTAVPEPGTTAALVLAGATTLALRRRG